MADEYVIVLTTIGVDVNPATIGMRLVEERLAACVNALPEMDSFFRWHGAVERDQERQLVIKTTAVTAARARAAAAGDASLRAARVPRRPGEAGERGVLKWVSASTSIEE